MLLPEPPIYRYLRRFTLAVVAVWTPLALFSGYRALVQVYSLDVRVTPARLTAGAQVVANISASGRTHVDVVVELLQDGRVDTLGTSLVTSNRTASVDPRPRKERLVVELTAADLQRIHPGVVTLRVTARGRPQWTRTPPPTIREIRFTCPPDTSVLRPAQPPTTPKSPCLQQHV